MGQEGRGGGEAGGEGEDRGLDRDRGGEREVEKMRRALKKTALAVLGGGGGGHAARGPASHRPPRTQVEQGQACLSIYGPHLR